MDALAKHTTVTLYPLHIGPAEDGVHEVGRPETAMFIQLPTEGVALIQWLDEGLSLDEARDAFAAKFEVTPELDVFIAGLRECGFIKAIDGQPVVAPVSEIIEQGRPRGLRLLATLPQRRVAWLMSTPLRICYLAIWLAVPVLLVARPDLTPRFSDALWHPSVMMNVAILTVVGWVLIFIHELAHILAARARGCAGALSINRRLYFLVAQTDMSGVRAIPRSQRYGPYLAGMTFDMAALLVCTLLRIAGIGGDLPGVIGYLVAVQTLFQCAVFLRTDLYFVMTNWLRVGNLAEDTRTFLKNYGRRIRGKSPVALDGVPDREQRIIKWYAPLYVLGISVLMVNFIVLILPALFSMTATAVAGLAGEGWASRWDGVAFLAAVAANFGTLGVLMYREQRARTRSRSYRSAR